VDVRADKLNGYERFAECGFSERIIGVLIKAGINAPEQLLSMSPDRIGLIQGIGPTLMKEIEQYRARATSTP
jgi:hypothetical protein